MTTKQTDCGKKVQCDTNCTDKTDYKIFVADLAASFLAKKENDNLETNTEFLAMVATAFRTVVPQVMDDTGLYRESLPIDIYAGVKRYDITPPDGYYVSDVIGLEPYKAAAPPFTFDFENIWLNCCPDKDVDKAFYVRVALVPNRVGGPCTFSTQFINRYYNLIRIGMQAHLMEMPSRTWKSLTQGANLRNKYEREIKKTIHKATVNKNQIRLKTRNITDYAVTGTRCPANYSRATD